MALNYETLGDKRDPTGCSGIASAIVLLVTLVLVLEFKDMSLSLSVLGTVTDATVSKIEKVKDSYATAAEKARPPKLDVSLEWQDKAGKKQSGDVTVYADKWTLKKGEQIKLVYLDSSPHIYRLYEDGSPVWVPIGLIAVAFLLIVLALFTATRKTDKMINKKGF
jgi:hypothetical protein